METNFGGNYLKDRNERAAKSSRLHTELSFELDRFWRHCNSRIDTSREQRLDRLKQFSQIRIGGKAKIKRTRERFVSRGTRGGGICFVCSLLANVRHHIIQIQHGGGNSHRNIVRLCQACHAVIHPWLRPANKLTNNIKEGAIQSDAPAALAVNRRLTNKISTLPDSEGDLEVINSNSRLSPASNSERVLVSDVNN